MSITTRSEWSLRRKLARLRQLLEEQLQQGLAPRRMAFALALGATLGLLPTLWGTSLLCFLCAWWLRLNQPLVQLANYLVYPLQILLFIPYLRAGDRLFSLHSLPPNIETLTKQLQENPLQFMAQLGGANLRAVAAWGLSAPLLLVTGYLLTTGLIRLFSAKKQTRLPTSEHLLSLACDRRNN